MKIRRLASKSNVKLNLKLDLEGQPTGGGSTYGSTYFNRCNEARLLHSIVYLFLTCSLWFEKRLVLQDLILAFSMFYFQDNSNPMTSHQCMQFHMQLHNFLLPYNDTLLLFGALELSQHQSHWVNTPNCHKIQHNVDLVLVFVEMLLKYVLVKIYECGNTVGCVFPMAIVPIIPHAEFRRIDHW